MPLRDPIQRVAPRSADLDDVVFWRERTVLDSVAVAVHRVLAAGARVGVVALAASVVAGEFALTLLAAVEEPVVGLYVLLSVVPAFGLAAFVWRSDATRRQPLGALVVTFLLGFAFAGFAAVLNSTFEPFFGSSFGGLVLFFFLVVGPVEETVKWAAVRLYAYRRSAFDAVVDGAVYGAAAGLGFATIENTLYISGKYLAVARLSGPALELSLQTAAVRTLAGPGHVIYSAFAGYYLGLAKFNARDRGPIAVKGLLVAVFIHAAYNSVVSVMPAVVDVELLPPASQVGLGVAFLGFILVYDGLFGYALYRKLAAYRDAYLRTGADAAEAREEMPPVGREDFDP
ncbi:MAG: PrsW family intramembrane metalloprotease [Halobacteriaceae archaeon]